MMETTRWMHHAIHILSTLREGGRVLVLGAVHLVEWMDGGIAGRRKTEMWQKNTS